MSNFFGKKELFIFSLTLLVIILISFFGLKLSFRRARDDARRADISAIEVSLIKFKEEYGIYPLSSPDGKIEACLGDKTVVVRRLKIYTGAVACNWGEDIFTLDPTDVSFPRLLNPIPRDPRSEDGYSYMFISDGANFQVYAAFEGTSEPEYNASIEKLKLNCGSKVCNVGKASLGAALDKPLK